MSTIQVTVCDRCREVGKPTKHYVVLNETSRAAVDLCAEDAQALDSILDEFARRTPARTPHEARVATMEEVAQRRRPRTR